MSERVIPIARASSAGSATAVDAHAVPAVGYVADRRGRALRDLRISVTDRCNFRCVYCMPREVFDQNYAFVPHDQLLKFEEITRLARLFVAHGVEKLRLTGGEPLLRRHLEGLIEMLAALRRPDGAGLDLTLTTNGSLLTRKAKSLAAAGLHRVTVSLDALDDDRFQAMTDAPYRVADVLAGIDAAADAGLGPVKVNMVVKRGTNDEEIVAMARRFRGTGHIVRFIEYMDVGTTNGWRLDEVVPSAEVLARIDAVFPLESLEPNYPGEVAQRWRYRDGQGEIGVISSVTQTFCGTCSRARLSTEGQLFTCLFGASGTDLRAPLRAGATDDTLSDLIGSVWQARTDRYSEIRGEATLHRPKVEMSYIGG